MTRPSPGLVMLTLLQVACSIVVVATTSSRLIRNPWGSAGQEQCLLSSHPAEAGLCSYALVLASASMCSAILAGCLRCVSCDCFGLGPLPNILLTAVNCLWWLVGAAVLTAAVTAADAAKLPALPARHLVLAAAWTAAVSELFHAFLACIVVGNNVCNILFCVPSAPEGGDDCCADCCCCCRKSRRHGSQPHAHHTEPLLQPLAAAAAVAAVAALPRRWGTGGQPQPQPQQQAMPQPQGAWAPAPAAPGYQPPAMPPPPTAGVPYVVSYQPGPGAPSPSAGVPVAGRPQAAVAAGSFAGFTSAPGGFSTETPTTGFGGAAAAPSAPPYAPPVVVQQQQQQQQPPGALTPPAVASMDAAGDAYPVISKQ